jgi:hypothetical protein
LAHHARTVSDESPEGEACGGTAPQVIGRRLFGNVTDLNGSLMDPADVAAWAKQISAKGMVGRRGAQLTR